MTANVLGLDLGLARAGAAHVHDDGRVYSWQHQTEPLPPGCPIEVTAHRVRGVARWAVERATTSTVLVVVEGPSFASRHGQAHERAGVWWRTVDALCRAEVPVAVLPPATVKKYVTGNGNASKDLMRSTVAQLYPGRGIDRVSKDQADAIGLALCGADWLGWPGPYLEGRRGVSWLRAANWPERATIPTTLETTP